MRGQKVGALLDRLMNQAGVSNYKLAREIDTDASLMGKWRRGEVVPSTDACHKLAGYFGVPATVFLEAAGHYKPSDDAPSVDAEVMTDAQRLQRLAEEDRALVRHVIAFAEKRMGDPGALRRDYRDLVFAGAGAGVSPSWG